jgi:hypothetical protein
MRRREFITGLAGSAAMPRIARAQLPVAPSSSLNAWLYETPAGPGAFERNGAANWVERIPTGGQMSFEEKARTADYLELYDGSRRLWVRVHPTFMEWRQEPSSEWHRLHTGRWVAAGEVPFRPDYRIRVAYFVPSDRNPRPNYEQKIRVLLHFVSELYRQSLQPFGWRAAGLPFQERAGEPVVHLIRGAKPAAYYSGAPAYNGDEQYRKLSESIPTTVGVATKQVIILLAETFDDGPAKFEWAGGIALGARNSTDGGLGIFSAWVLQDAFCATSVQAQRQLLFDATPIRGRVALGNGRMNSPRFQFIEDGFGVVAHELGHAFGAPHDLRGERDIMGNGFRNMRANFANPPQPGKTANFSEDGARLLLSSRHLAADPYLTDNSPPQVAIRIVSAARARGRASATVSVDASDDRGLRAVLFFLLDVEDLSQSSTVGGRWLTGKQQSFTHTLVFDPPSSGQIGIEAYVTDQGGNLTRVVAKTRI